MFGTRESMGVSRALGRSLGDKECPLNKLEERHEEVWSRSRTQFHWDPVFGKGVSVNKVEEGHEEEW